MKKHTPPSLRGFLLLIRLCRRPRINQPTYIRVNKRKHILSSSRRLIYSMPVSIFVWSGGSGKPSNVLTRQGRLCNINIKLILMPKIKNKKEKIFYQLPHRGSINRKMKKLLEKEPVTKFFLDKTMFFKQKWLFLSKKKHSTRLCFDEVFSFSD